MIPASSKSLPWAAAMLMLFASASFAAAQTDSTITLPVPERGILYIRSGGVGGVTASPPEAEVPPPAAPPEETPALDLARLDDVLRRLGPGERLEMVATPRGPLVVILADRPGAPPDTVYVERLYEPPPADEPGVSPPVEPAATQAKEVPAGPPRVDEPAPVSAADVERALLDAGLFRTVRVHFAFDEAALLPSARPTLEAVAEVLRRHPGLRIRVAGHADRIGTEAYNLDLSRRRAAAVRAYLARRVEGGLERIEAVGYGEARPLLDGDGPTVRALNRRVGFEVIAPPEPVAAPAPDSAAVRRSIEEAVREAFADPDP